MRQAEWCLLADVCDRHAEGRAVADRIGDLAAGLGRDHDPDVPDPGLDERLDAVEEDRLVGNRHELLRRGVGDRAQAGSLAAREDQALEALHVAGKHRGRSADARAHRIGMAR